MTRRLFTQNRSGPAAPRVPRAGGPPHADGGEGDADVLPEQRARARLLPEAGLREGRDVAGAPEAPVRQGLCAGLHDYEQGIVNEVDVAATSSSS